MHDLPAEPCAEARQLSREVGAAATHLEIGRSPAAARNSPIELRRERALLPPGWPPRSPNGSLGFLISASDAPRKKCDQSSGKGVFRPQTSVCDLHRKAGMLTDSCLSDHQAGRAPGVTAHQTQTEPSPAAISPLIFIGAFEPEEFVTTGDSSWVQFHDVCNSHGGGQQFCV